LRFMGEPASGRAPATAEVTVHRFALASPAAATVLGTWVVVLAAVYIPLAGLVHQLTILNIGPMVATILIYAAVGVVVARHRRAIRWGGYCLFSSC
jgi:hypothetical protein